MVGLDYAGKTTMAYKLSSEVNTTIPTIGFTIEEWNHKGIHFKSWDVGGSLRIRPLFRHYYGNIDLLTFVVDATDHERLEDAKDEFYKMIYEEQLRDVIILLMVNKSDLPDAKSLVEIVDYFEMDKLAKEKVWNVIQTSATTGLGIDNAIKWCLEALKKK